MEKSMVAFLLLFLLGFGNGQQYDNKEILVDASKHDEQFFTFLSRPDIDAARWEFKVYNESALAPGYWFVSPYGKVEQTDNDKPYVGPAIYDPKNGELVWNGAPRFQRYNTFSLKVTKHNGKDWISVHHPEESHGVLMNEKYEIRRHIRTGINGQTGNMHDFQIVDNGNKALYLTTIVKRTSVENSLAVGFDGRCRVAFIGFQERDVETEELLFDWSPEGRIGLDESDMYDGINTPTHDCANDNFDYLHLNSIEKLPDKDYLVSGRRTYAIYKVSHKDGSIVWRLGGKKSDFKLEDGTHFTGQHDVRCLSQNSTHMIVSMMDNAMGRKWTDITNPNSRGLVLSVDTETMTAREISTFDHPYGVGAYAPERGNFQTLPNGNGFLSWTKNALHSEHSPDGQVIAEAMFPSGLKTYRSYKFPWVGLPQSPPDVHSQVVTSSNGSISTVVHVSWNGDTEVERWNLYETNVDGTTSDLLASRKRTGFETAILYDGYAAFVRVDAVDRDGKKRKESKSHVARTIALLGSEGSIPHLPATGSWSEMLKNPKDTLSNPVSTFFGGVVFCAAALLAVWVVKKKCGRGALSWRRKQRLYAALNDSDEDAVWPEGSGLLDEKNKSREPLAEDHED